MNEGELKETAAPFRTEAYQSPFAPLIDELYREEVLDARRMSPEEKFLAGEELFRYACSITLAGIRNQFPALSEEECLKILEQRLELGSRMEWQR